MRKAMALIGLMLGCGLGAWAGKPSAFGTQSKPMQATVQILAVSSSSRQNFAGNQDVYLAEVQVKGGERQFARVIDQYPGFGLPIQRSLLRDKTAFMMKLTREPECDVPGSEVYLRRTGGQIFDGSVRDTLRSRASESIPCFRTLHQTIKLAKP